MTRLTELDAENIHQLMVQRAEDMEHLIQPVLQQLEDQLVTARLNDQGLAEAVEELEAEYWQDRRDGRLYVLASIKEFLEDINVL